MTRDIPGSPKDYLKINLSALASRSPMLFERLCWPMRNDHVILTSSTSGNPTAKLNLKPEVYLHSSSDPVREAFDAVKQLAPMRAQPFFCLGLGLGYYLNALLSTADPSQPIFAYERDPWLLRLTLSLFDFSRDILAGRVEFLLGTDLHLFHTVRKRDLRLWPHPVLGSLYEEERRLLSCDPELIKSERRAMVVAGGLFVSDVVDALSDSHVQALVWDARSLSREETVHQIRQFDPNMVISINYCDGLPELCQSLGLPALIWEIDPSIERFHQNRKKELHQTFIYTYRKSRVTHYLNAGFSKVEYLPLAANPKRRYPMLLSGEEQDKYGANLSFVGSSMASEADSLCRLYEQLTEKTAQGSEKRKELVVQDDCGRLVDLTACLAEKTASERRAHILSLLTSRNYDLRVWGDAGWQKILPDNARYCGLAGYSREITRIYNATKINLDINRIYQQDIVTMRIFDILACKSFVLADYGECLGELFQLDREVIAYRSESEIPALVDYFLVNDHERNDIALAGYQRVLRDHTIFGRVQNMLQNLP